MHGSFSVNVAFYFSWVDNRIEILDPNAANANVDNEFLKHIWTPDFYIYDLQRFRPQGVLSNGEGLRIMKLDSNNTGSLIALILIFNFYTLSVAEIHYSVEAEVIIKCPINYSKFPFHSATCKLKVTSVSNRNTTMVFQSDQRPAEKLMNPSVDIYGYYVNTRYLEEKETIALSWDNENEWFSVVGLRINMVSRYWKYLFIYFMPTTMFTMTSWVSHLLPPTSYPARTSLLVTVFLCQVGVFTAAINHTPNSDGGIASTIN